ncbi:MAG: hypothetical protein JO244_10450, partial [Solirubrobacterales bacterium]|nr:hypothetical protein [Solirubrobacterales bacterium]
GQVAIALIQPQGGLFSTRCAGPLDSDLAGRGPQFRLSLGQLLRGRRTIPLSGTWSFAAGGFAGTIDSNLTLALGRPSVQRTSSRFPGAFQRDRQVTETLTLVRGTGSLSLALGGDPSTCEFLDSCGIQGSLNGSFAPQGATASLFVLGSARRPYVDFLAALGLSRRGNPRGLEVAGTLDWLSGGTLTAQLEQGAACTSTAPLNGGLVVFGSGGRGVSASYSPSGSPRTRCPGPEIEQFQPLASGSIPRAMLGRSSFSLHLSGSGPLTDDGYTINQHTSLTLTLKRGRLHQFFFRVPLP